MDYEQTLQFLFNSFPAFHKIGSGAYKPGLDKVKKLSAAFGDPHTKLRAIHVAGTNGKGSTSHTLASILQSAGYRVGLFTSPHIVDFRERIRVDGRMIKEEKVVSFVDRYMAARQSLGDDFQPSFFELTTVMAFDYFAASNVDVAVIEVGLGGRLDSTNILDPILSVVTNISLDHTSLLGSTEVEIAREKAGIIKPGRPVVIGESAGDVRKCFAEVAASRGSGVVYADDADELQSATAGANAIHYATRTFGEFDGELCGSYQIKNAATVLEAVRRLRHCGLVIGNDSVARGFGNVCRNTGLMGRWTTLSRRPLTVCDTGHNPGGWKFLSRQLASFAGKKRLVVGFVNDKDVSRVLEMIAEIPDSELYFTSPSTPRALPAESLAAIGRERGLHSVVSDNVVEAYKKALADVVDESSEMVFIGGSTFVVSDLLCSDCFDLH